jgi:hypothetical protein
MRQIVQEAAVPTNPPPGTTREIEEVAGGCVAIQIK